MVRSLSARNIEEATRVITEQGVNIDSILRLTGRQSIRKSNQNVRACIEFSLRGTPKDYRQMQANLMQMSHEQGIDFFFAGRQYVQTYASSNMF